MLFGVEEVDDLDGVGEVLGGEVPDPQRAVAEDDAPGGALEPTPHDLTLDPCRKLARRLVRVPLGRALDRRRVGHRARIAHRRALLVSPLGAPHRAQLDLTRLGRPVGLLARAAFQLRSAHRDARTVHAHVERRRHRLVGRRRLDHAPLLGRDLAPERLGRALDVLGRHRHPGQVAQELVALGEADRRAHQAHHAQHARRQRRALHAQRCVARAEAGRARVAVEVGPLDRQRPQDAGEGLGPTVDVARELAASGARHRRAAVVRGVSVDPLLDGAGRHAQRLAACRRLDRLEVPALDGVGAYERFDLRDDFGREGRFEPPFLTASCAAASGASSWASAQRSQASQ